MCAPFSRWRASSNGWPGDPHRPPRPAAVAARRADLPLPVALRFCYNPVDFARTSADDELDTEAWLRVLNEARAQGSVQCGFSGGEPLVRDDLEVLVAEAHRLGYYTNLLTSGVGLTEDRAEALKRAGWIISSSPSRTPPASSTIFSRTRAPSISSRRWRTPSKANGWPMVMNCVIHRLNIDHVDKIIEMAVALDAEYLELANSQYYSWALLNRDQLLPSREQIERAERITNEYRETLGDSVRIFFVVPDYYETRPRSA